MQHLNRRADVISGNLALNVLRVRGFARVIPSCTRLIHNREKLRGTFDAEREEPTGSHSRGAKFDGGVSALRRGADEPLASPQRLTSRRA